MKEKVFVHSGGRQYMYMSENNENVPPLLFNLAYPGA